MEPRGGPVGGYRPCDGTRAPCPKVGNGRAQCFENEPENLVPPDEESLNDIFQTLADWEYQLKACREVIPREIFDDQEGPAP